MKNSAMVESDSKTSVYNSLGGNYNCVFVTAL